MEPYEAEVTYGSLRRGWLPTGASTKNHRSVLLWGLEVSNLQGHSEDLINCL